MAGIRQVVTGMAARIGQHGPTRSERSHRSWATALSAAGGGLQVLGGFSGAVGAR